MMRPWLDRPVIVALIAGALGLGLWPGSSSAQSFLRPHERRSDLPALPDQGAAPPAPTLAPVPGAAPPGRAPVPGADPRVSAGTGFPVGRIEVTGNTAIADAVLAEIVAPFEGRVLTIEELIRVQRALTRAYVDAGYVNSGAVIPDQTVADGVVRIEIVEGRLDQVEIVGADWLRAAWIEGRLRHGAGEPLNVGRLQDSLERLLTDPAIDRLNARLGPGTRPGESRFELEVTETDRPYFLTAEGSNSRTTSVGSETLTVTGGVRSLLGYGDPLVATAGLAEGIREVGLSYAVPLTESDLRLKLRGEFTQSSVVEEPLDTLDITGQTMSGEIGLSHPIWRDAGDDLGASVSLVRRHTSTTLLERQFSFSPGSVNGETDVTAARFTLDWTHRERTQVWAVRSQLSWGFGGLGATVHDENTGSGSLPDSEFLAWLGQAQYTRRLFTDDDQLLARVDVQYAFDRLLTLEQIAVGGINTVRGYRENQVLRDNAVIGSIEYRYPLFNYALFKDETSGDDAGRFEIVPFFDAARAWNKAETAAPRSLYSVGIGVRWSPIPRLEAELYWAQALNEPPKPQSDDVFQDNGIHFRLRAQLL